MKINSVYPSRELNITCKGMYNEKRANNDDLTSVLNELSIAYGGNAEVRVKSVKEAVRAFT